MPIIPLNAPNVLTLARIAMVPAMVALIIAGDDAPVLLAPAAVFGVAALTDVADGHLARSRDMITKFGRLADPLADKLLVGTALVSLVAVERLALWVAAAIIAREVAVTGLRWHARREGVEVEVSGLGKAKTGAQMLAIPMLMLVPDPAAVWVQGILAAVVGVTIASGLDYARTYARRRRSAVAVTARMA